MTSTIDTAHSLENIYISPLESCNLNCKLCYTHKNRDILSNSQISDFIARYQKYLNNELKLKLKSILFCGGEVFLLKNFPGLVNSLLSKGIFISIITNGTLNHLSDINDPKNCQLLVSIDGNREIHDQNRGQGNFDKSIEFIKTAIKLGFPTEIMFLISPKSYSLIDSLPDYLHQLVGQKLNLNYITQKTFFYTSNHPLSNQKDQQPALAPDQIMNIKKKLSINSSKLFWLFSIITTIKW